MLDDMMDQRSRNAITGEPCELKGSSTVLREAVGKGSAMIPRWRPTYNRTWGKQVREVEGYFKVSSPVEKRIMIGVLLSGQIGGQTNRCDEPTWIARFRFLTGERLIVARLIIMNTDLVMKGHSPIRPTRALQIVWAM